MAERPPQRLQGSRVSQEGMPPVRLRPGGSRPCRAALLRQHDSESGFAIGAILFLLTMIGVGGAVLYSGYSQILRTNISITRENAAKNDLIAAARTLSASSVLINGGLNLQPPAVLPFGSADAAKLPTNYANSGTTGSPTAVGVMQAGAGTNQLDPWGHYYVYCRWENATNPGSDPGILIITAGPDGVLDTKCGDITAQNDDKIQLLSIAQAIDRANVWQYQTTTGGAEVQFGITGNAVRVTNSGDISANSLTLAGALNAGTLSLTAPLAVNQGGTGSSTAAGARGNLGSGTAGDALFTAATAAGARGVLGSTTVGDALFTAANAGAARTTLGATSVGSSVFTAADAAAGRAALGSGTTGDALFTAATATGARTTLGATTVGDALFTAADAGTARTTLGATSVGSSVFTAASGAAARAAIGAGTTGDAVFVSANQTQALTALGLLGGSLTLDVGITGTANTAVYLADGANILAGTVPVNRGGTGASTAATARSNLGADNATNITSGTLSWTRLPTSGVTAGAYNWGTVNAYGIVEAAQNVLLTSATNLDISNNLYIGSGHSGGYGVGGGTNNATIYFPAETSDASYIRGTVTGTQTILTLHVGDDSPDTIQIDTAGAGGAVFGQVLLQPTGGNVGIGITTTGTVPADKLDINGGHLRLTGTATNDRLVRFATTTALRWAMGADSTAESGSNAGSNFVIRNYNDAGTLLGTPFSIDRATGNVTINGTVTATTFIGGSGGAGAIALGTSATGTNPARSGEVGTGLFTAASGQVNVAASGSEIARFSSSGIDARAGVFLQAGVQALKLSATGNPVVGNTTMSISASPLSVAVGRDALASVSGEVSSVAVGHRALASATTATANTALGFQALQATTTGTENVAVGYQALAANVGGTDSTAVGFKALAASTTGDNTAFGAYALTALTTGSRNTSLGDSALPASTTGTSNTAVGTAALNVLTGGASNNTAVGDSALGFSTSAANNTAVGYAANLYNTTGNNNTALGYWALAQNRAKRESTAVGYSAMYYADSSTTGAVTYNTGIGAYALRGSVTAANNTGTSNTAVGHSALFANTTGSSNAAFGALALTANTTGANNLALGNGVASTTLTTGSNNILIGTSSAVDTPAAGTSNWLNIGNTIYGDLSNKRIAIGNGLTTTTAGVTFDLGSVTDSMRLPVGTTAQRPGTGAQGMLRYNSTTGTGVAEYYDGSAWQSLATSSSAGSITLGATATATNPSRSGEAGTGLFSAATGQVSVASNGVEVGRFNATGLQLTTATGAYQINGLNALRLTSTGNPIIGSSAMSGTAAPLSIGIGRDAMASASAEQYAVAVGHGALALATTATGNTAMGYWSMISTTTGTANTAYGFLAASSNTTGSYNNAVGGAALFLNTTGSHNNAFGAAALYANTIGSFNIAIGSQALNLNTIGSGNIAIGSSALATATGVSGITAVGYQALNVAQTAAANNTAVGYQTLAATTTGAGNTAMGNQALMSNTTGASNTSVGAFGLFSNTTGYSNTTVGNASLFFNTSGYGNTSLGVAALYWNTTGNSNTAIGNNALQYTTTGANNVALGSGAGSSVTTGGRNVVLGSDVASTTLTTGSSNILIGTSAAVDTPAAGTSNWLNIGNTVYGDTNTKQIAIGSGIAALTSGVVFDLGSNTNSMRLPVGTTAQRPGTGAQGMLRYNSTTGAGVAEYYDGSAWQSLATSSSVGTIALGASATANNPQRSGDATTGLFSPAASTVAIAAAGSEALRVSATGSLGIGTTAPQEKFNLSGGDALISTSNMPAGSQIYLRSSSGGGVIEIKDTDDTNSVQGEVKFTDAAGTAVGRLGGYNLYTNGEFGLRSNKALNIDAGNTTRIRIDGTTGNVGIGTTAPTNILSLGGDAAQTFWMERRAAGGFAGNSLTVQSGGALSGATNANGGDLLLSSGISTGTGSSNIQFQTAAAGASGTTDRTPATRMTIDGNGNVGIGTTTPTSLLSIKSGNATVTRLLNASNVSVVESGIENLGSGFLSINNTAGASKIYARADTALGPYLLIDGSGYNISAGGFYGAALGIYVPTTIGEQNGIVFSNSGNSIGAAITSYTASNTLFGIQGLNFSTGNGSGPVTRMTIDNLGKIGVGTTTPAVSFDLASKTDAIALPVGSTAQRPTGAAGMLRYNTTTADAGVEYYDGSAWTKLATGSGSTIVFGASATANNPQRSGEAGTGLFSAATGQVSVASNGVEIGRLDASGLQLTTSTGAYQINGLTALKLTSTGNPILGQGAAASALSIAIGRNALAASTNGAGNVAIGHLALTANTSGGLNTAVGYNTLSANVASLYNTAVGALALAANTGGSNTAVGYAALAATTTSALNTAIGRAALAAVTTGTGNSGLGYGAGGKVTTGSYNLALGYAVGSTTLTTGSNNILIGSSSAVDTPAASTSNWLNIGNTVYGDTSSTQIAIGSGIAALTSDVVFDLGSNTNSMRLPVGTTAQRPGTGAQGMLRYNSTTGAGVAEYYDGSAWQSLATSSSVGTIALGATATANNPQRSGDATTGLFSAAAGTVSVAAAGTEMLRATATALIVDGQTAISNRYIRTTDPNNISLGGNNGVGLVVGYDNKVAVGESAAQAVSQLEVIGATFTDFRINSGNVSKWTFATDYSTDSNLYLNRTAGSGNFVFNTGYNVGVGVTGPSAKLHVVGADGTSGAAPNALTVVGGTGGTNGAGGAISLTAGNGAGTGIGGALTLTAGGSVANAAVGGDATVSAGSGLQGGSLVLRSGNAWAGGGQSSITLGGSGSITSGNVTITSGSTNGAAPGNVGSITIQTPSTTTGYAANSGNINLTAGNGEVTGTGGTINITAGGGGASDVAGSNVVLNGGAGGGLGAAGNVLLANTRGNVGVGTASPAYKLDISSTGGMRIPVGTTAQRPTGAQGVLRYNSTTGAGVVEYYDGSAWQNVASGSGSGSSALGSSLAAAAPARSGEANTGLYSTATGTVQIGGLGSEVARFVGAASQVNYLQFSGAATTAAPTITAAGTDTNITISLTPKGSGKLNLTTGSYQLAGNNAYAVPVSTSLVVGNSGGTAMTGANNTSVGYQALNASTTGFGNAAFGSGALGSNTVGFSNNAFGYAALQSNTSGNSSNAFGTYALANSTADANTAMGGSALYSTTTGAFNTAFGYYTLQANINGQYNVAVGSNALAAATNVSGQVAVGYQALTAATTATGNTAVGYQTLKTATTGSNNTAMGYQVLNLTTTGIANAAFGYQAMLANTSGSYNQASGYQALYANTTGVNNTAAGSYALYGNVTGSSNAAVGTYASFGNSTGTQNNAFGNYALYTNTTGSNNNAIGYRALYATTTGSSNNAMGQNALQANTTGQYNVAVGDNALAAATTPSGQIAIGYQALTAATTATGNTAVGYQAGKAVTTGRANVALGYQALTANTTGSNNIAIGNQAALTGSPTDTITIGSGTLGSSQDVVIGGTAQGSGSTVAVGYAALAGLQAGNDRNTAVGYGAAGGNSVSSSYAVALGYLAMYLQGSGTSNTGVGAFALYSNIAGASNAAMGASALQAATGSYNSGLGASAGNSVTSGSNNTVLGYAVGSTTLTTGSSNILIGTSAAVDTPAAGTSNWLNIGNTVYGDTNTKQVAIGSGLTAMTTGVVFDLGSNTNSMRLPVGTTAQRPGTGAQGMLRYNSTTGAGVVEYYDGSAWQNVASGSGGSSTLGSSLAAAAPARSGEANTGLYSTATGTVQIGGLGSEVARFVGAASQVNYLQFSGAATTAAPTITAAGTDTNITISLTPKGTGKLNLTTGSYQLAGVNAFSSPTSGSYVIGDSGATAMTGMNNLAIGYQALNVTTTGVENVAVGRLAMAANTSGANNVAVGNIALAGNTTASANTAVGYAALNSVSSGGSNVAVGYNALLSTTTGTNNTAIGTTAMQSNTQGQFNTAVGSGALASNVSGQGTSAFGYQALYSNLAGSTGILTSSSAFGYQALYTATGGNANNAFGLRALYSNTTGSTNNAFGSRALYFTTTGSGNSAFGQQALTNTTTGNNNVGIGYQTGFNITSGSYNVVIGNAVGSGLTTGSNNILIGNNSTTTTPTASTDNWLNIGGVIFGATATAAPQIAIGSGIAALTSGVVFDLGSNTNSMRLPVGTTAQRPGTGAQGMLRYNTTTGSGSPEYYDGSAWQSLGAGGGGTITLGASATANNPQVSGDATTGLFSPAASTVAIATAGTEAFRVTATGSVGLGTTAPSGALSLGSTVSNKKLFVYDDGTNAMGLGVANSEFRIFGASSGTNHISFGKYDLSGNSFTEQVRIDNSGKLNLTTGSYQIAGVNALANPASGSYVLGNTTGTAMTGTDNFAVGTNAMQSTTTGAANIAIGVDTLKYNTTGSGNVAMGTAALFYNTTAGGNIAIGATALSGTTTAGGNVAIGANSQNSSVAPYNTSVGYLSMYSNTTGTNNVAVGAGNYTLGGPLGSNTTGSNNVALGYGALAANKAKSESTAVGYQAMLYAHDTTSVAVSYNTAVGAYALQGSAVASANTGTGNTALGHSTLLANTTGSGNIAVGLNALNKNTTGANNTVVGTMAFVDGYNGGPTTGSNNVAVGFSTLSNGSYGDSTAVGAYASYLASGTSITAIGYQALASSGSYGNGAGSTVVGASAWQGGGQQNAVVGAFTGSWSGTTAGNYNSVLGYNGLYKANGANYNSVVGYNALSAASSAANNTVLGANVASTTLDTGSNNILIGTSAAVDTPAAGTSNWLNIGGVIFGATATAAPQIAIGSGIAALTTGIVFDLGSNTNSMRLPKGTTAQRPTGQQGMLRYNTTTGAGVPEYYDGSSWQSLGAGGGGGTDLNSLSDAITDYSTTYNMFLGSGSGAAITTGTNNTALGYQALAATTTGSFNTAIGYQALATSITGASNTAVGFQALALNTTGTPNDAFGRGALYRNTTGSANSGFGNGSLTFNTSGNNNAAHGYNALYANSTGNNNSAFGIQALASNTTADYNTAVGYGALNANTTGTQNTAIGQGALYASVTGNYNTGLGEQALRYNVNGSSNTAVGQKALFVNTSGANNTILGFAVASTTLTTGSNNILIGTSSAVDTPAAGTNNWINIGNQLVSSWATTGSETIGLNRNTTGTAGTTALIVGTGANNGNGALLTAGGVWTNASDRRIKEDIQPLGYGLDTVMRLKPVAYKMKDTHVPQIGFIAQDVEQVLPEVVVRPANLDDPNQHYTMSYGNMVAVAVKAIQELKAENDNLRQQVAALQQAAPKAEATAPVESGTAEPWLLVLTGGGIVLLLGLGGVGMMVLRLRREMRALRKVA